MCLYLNQARWKMSNMMSGCFLMAIVEGQNSKMQSLFQKYCHLDYTTSLLPGYLRWKHN